MPEKNNKRNEGYFFHGEDLSPLLVELIIF